MEEFRPVIRTQELGPGELHEAQVDGRSIVVLNVGQTYYALDARCPHDGTNLARDGHLDGHLLVCPSDDAAYDVRTGERVGEPGSGLHRYGLRVEGNIVKVESPE